MLSARSNQMETLGNLREELVRFITLSNSHLCRIQVISTKGSHLYCLYFKVAQNFGVGHLKQYLRNLLYQVTVAVYHKEEVLFDPVPEKFCQWVSSCNSYLHSAAACSDSTAGGIEHTPVVSHTPWSLYLQAFKILQCPTPKYRVLRTGSVIL